MKKFNKRKFDEIVITLCASLAFSACANKTATTDDRATATTMKKEVQVAESEGAHVVSRIQFDEGRTTLTPAAQEELRMAIEQARSMGKVEAVTLAVWSDKEYPTTQKRLTSKQIELADKRGKEIERYLDKNMDVDDVKVHNMSKQPNAMEKFFNTSDARLKEKLVAAGISNEKGVVSENGRASSALLLIELE